MSLLMYAIFPLLQILITHILEVTIAAENLPLLHQGLNERLEHHAECKKSQGCRDAMNYTKTYHDRILEILQRTLLYLHWTNTASLNSWKTLSF